MPNAIRVLFSEDHIDTLQVVAYMLSRKGFDMLRAESVAKGIALGRGKDFDVLICDIGLQDGHGEQVLDALRITNKFNAIALTAHANEEERKIIIDRGFDRCLLKPFYNADLVTAVEVLFGQLHEDK